MLPNQRDIELPLLEVLVELGGQGDTKEIYPRVTRKFPNIKEEDLIETLPSGPNKWQNRIQWVRQALIMKGEISSPKRGVWAITDTGRLRVKTKEISTPTVNFNDLYEDYDSSFHSILLDKLNELDPHQFELFAGKILQAYGFTDVQVTGKTADGGIDGHGKLRLGLATIGAAFQCKRWKGNVPRPEIDKFRGAIQGQFEQGIFFVTSDFSSQATEVSVVKGAVPIILINGKQLVDLMIEKEIGVKRIPLYLYYERASDFMEEE